MMSSISASVMSTFKSSRAEGETEIRRFVMVIGESGVGKSTIVNMLYNQGAGEAQCKAPCRTGATAASVTKQSSVQISLSTSTCFVDTVGIGDPALDQAQLLQGIRSLIKYSVRGLHTVVVVAKVGRLTAGTLANIHALRELFHPEDLRSHGVLVLTHYPGKLGETEAEEFLAKWVQDDLLDDSRCVDIPVTEILGSFGKVILTNNTLARRYSREDLRMNCLDQLTQFIDARSTRVTARPRDWDEWIKYIFQRLAEKLGVRYATSMVALARALVDSAVPMQTYCGDCQECKMPIPLMEYIKLPCDHGFHSGCLQPQQGSCPFCKEPFDTCFSFEHLLNSDM